MWHHAPWFVMVRGAAVPPALRAAVRRIVTTISDSYARSLRHSLTRCATHPLLLPRNDVAHTDSPPQSRSVTLAASAPAPSEHSAASLALREYTSCPGFTSSDHKV